MLSDAAPDVARSRSGGRAAPGGLLSFGVFGLPPRGGREVVSGGDGADHRETTSIQRSGRGTALTQRARCSWPAALL